MSHGVVSSHVGRRIAWPLALLTITALGGGATAQEFPPWETWPDLHRLSRLHPGHQVLLRSSHCPDGCRFDRHSADQQRFIYVDREEGVIFEEAGAGAIARIWMTQGDGTSVPLDPDIQIRIYVDGAADPVVDLPLPALYDGSTPPFLPPLVGNRETSSGGNFSYVPIPYRDGCRVVLVGAQEKKIWFQINFHRLADATGVVSFTGQEDLSAFAALLALHGQDPWPPGSGTVKTGSLQLDPGAEGSLLSAAGGGTVTALRLLTGSARWPEIVLRLRFDGELTAEMPLADFFALGLVGPVPTRSLLVGVDDGGSVYSYFPKPFFDAAEITLTNLGASSASVDYEVRTTGDPPHPASGRFGAQLRQTDLSELGRDVQTATFEGRGKMAGTFVELGMIDNPVGFYVEGDERLFIDRSPHPSIYGTGFEDQFNGGFAFDLGSFARALHGSPYTAIFVDELPRTGAYRVMLTDGITFENRLMAGLEAGPTNDILMRARVVTYVYRQPQPGLVRWDLLDLGSEASRQRHDYQVAGVHEFRELTALFGGEPPGSVTGTGVYRPPGTASFTLRAPEGATRFRLRRRFDAGSGGQRASIFLGGQLAGQFPVVDVNDARRWREIDIDLHPAAAVDGELSIAVEAEAGLTEGSSEFSAFRYELWADGPVTIFADGFESGDLTAWGIIVDSSASTRR